MPARCFLAIGLTPAVRGALRGARAAFVDEAPDWAGEKWVAPELLHATLKFIGPLPDAAVDEALEALSAAAVCASRANDPASAAPGVRLRLDSVRAVPSSRRTGMLWATFTDPGGGAARLHRAVDDALSMSFGVAADERPFSPHATLLRTRRPRRAPDAALAAARSRLDSVPDRDRSMSVPSFTLLASTLGPGGPTYDVVGEVPLG